MKKNNQKFEFKEFLDMDALLPKSSKSSLSQQSQDTTIPKKYKLLSILVH